MHLDFKICVSEEKDMVKVVFTVTVKPATPPPDELKVTPAGGALPDETVGVDPGVQQIGVISGGKPPYDVKLTNGQLPQGQNIDLNEDGKTIELVGTPTVPGDSGFELTVTDATEQSA